MLEEPMKKLALLVLILALPIVLTSCFLSIGYKENREITDTSGSALVGTWVQREEGFHGNSIYMWSFGEDGRFAYLFTAYEPSSDGGSNGSSVRERFMLGNFRENGNTIECYNVVIDDYFSWGNKWRYFKNRDPENLANVLPRTLLKQYENMEDFTFDFTVSGATDLNIYIDIGAWPDQYKMDFKKI